MTLLFEKNTVVLVYEVTPMESLTIERAINEKDHFEDLGFACTGFYTSLLPYTSHISLQLKFEQVGVNPSLKFLKERIQIIMNGKPKTTDLKDIRHDVYDFEKRNL